VQLIIIGGICQVVAGVLSFRKYDHLSSTAFIGYAALWISYGVTKIYYGSITPNQFTNPIFLPTVVDNNSISFINTTGDNTSQSLFINNPTRGHYLEESAISGLIAYIILSFLLAFCSATVNYVMPFVFGAITLTLIFEAITLVSGPWAMVISGILELLILIFAIYGSAALLLKGLTQRLVLKGFGTPLFNVLLLGTASSAKAQKIGQEKKKNTKYAEPMALGFFCDTISSFIFIFYSFGYFTFFGLGALWVTIISGAQLFSSYYSCLRQDSYHATKFGVHATYWIINAWEEFEASSMLSSDNVTKGRDALIGDYFIILLSLVICVGGLNTDWLELVHNLLFSLVTVSTIPQIPLQVYYIFFGITCCLFTAISLYGTFARLINTIAEKSLIPVGPQPVSTKRFIQTLNCRKNKEIPCNTCHTSDPLFYLANGLASFSVTNISMNTANPFFNTLTVPWVLIPGTVIQFYISRLRSQSGRLGSVISTVYIALWTTFTWFRLTGTYSLTSTDWYSSHAVYGFTAGGIALLVINVFLVILASFRNLVLMFMLIVKEMILVCFLLSTLKALPYQLEVSMLVTFSAIALYGTLASLVNCILSKQVLSLGPAIFKEVKKEATPAVQCPVADSRFTSGLMKIAAILEEGGVCGIPTDTVYALAASCKKPEAIEKIYNIKDRPAEKPICICISHVDQLVAARPPFSPLLWEFMRNVYPGGISCIVSKGEWLFKLGVGPAYERVGTKDSIMIRVPDHTVTRHLCDLTGPLAITSANPSGETDSTHHSMVISRLGNKLQGVLCDGDSDEVVASTIVNCLNIDD
ncbi:hypothetical protein NL108_014861, partial [Boleophthalmus pectinirostris]